MCQLCMTSFVIFGLCLCTKRPESWPMKYAGTDRFPPSERYESTSQIRRAATSVAANIAEGNGQCYPAKELNFINTSIGSLSETRYWLEFGRDQDFIAQSDYERVDALCVEITKMLYGYMRRVKTVIDGGGAA